MSTVAQITRLIVFCFFLTVHGCPSELPAPCQCQDMPSGISIICERANVDDLAAALSAHSSVIEKLKIYNSDIQTLEGLSLSLLKVKKLDLSNNNIKNVEEDAFGIETPEIVELYMSNNSLTKVPDLRSLTSLQVFDISGNYLTDLEENCFSRNPLLRVIKAKSNRICSLSPNSLGEVKASLQVLDLSKNCFTQVPAPNVRGAQRLIALDLSYNAIESIQNLQFMNMPELQELRLVSNYITEIMPLAFMNLPKLENLILSYNKIRNLDTTRFQSFENLQLLDLSKNELDILPASAFKDFPKLKELHLADNRITTIETMAISSDPELRLINLAKNVIRTLYRNAFDSLPQLATLFLMDNKIQIIEEGVLSGMPNLQQLSLRSNEIAKIESNAFNDVSLLSTLDLGENKLSEIPKDIFAKMQHLFWLDLSNNQIRTIQGGAFGKRIANLLLHNNPFHCDETLNWLVTYMSTEKVRTYFPGQQDIICKTPESMAGKSVRSLVISKVNETMMRQQDLEKKLATDVFDRYTEDKNGATDDKGLLPSLDKLTNPLARLLENRKDSNNLADFIKRLQDILKNVQSGPLKNVSPELINYVLRGGQIPGVPPNMLKRFVENYAKSLVSKDNNDEVDLPPLSSLPAELVEDVMKGKPVLGLTADETVVLREKYLRKMIGPKSTIASLASLFPKGLKTPFSNLTKGGTYMGLSLSDLNQIDLSKVPLSFLTDLVSGQTPAINDVPLEVVQSIVERNPTYFGELVGQQLNKTVKNGQQINKNAAIISADDPPYDVSDLDRKGNLKMFDEHRRESVFDSGLITGIALGIVAMLTAVTALALCYQRMKKTRLAVRNSNPSFSAVPNSSPHEPNLPIKDGLSYSSTRKTSVGQSDDPRCYRSNSSFRAKTERETKDSGIKA